MVDQSSTTSSSVYVGHALLEKATIPMLHLHDMKAARANHNHIEIIGDAMRCKRKLEVSEYNKKTLAIELLNLLRYLVERGLLAFVGELTTMDRFLIPGLVEIGSALPVPALRGSCCF